MYGTIIWGVYYYSVCIYIMWCIDLFEADHHFTREFHVFEHPLQLAGEVRPTFCTHIIHVWQHVTLFDPQSKQLYVTIIYITVAQDCMTRSYNYSRFCPGD